MVPFVWEERICERVLALVCEAKAWRAQRPIRIGLERCTWVANGTNQIEILISATRDDTRHHVVCQLRRAWQLDASESKRDFTSTFPLIL